MPWWYLMLLYVGGMVNVCKYIVHVYKSSRFAAKKVSENEVMTQNLDVGMALRTIFFPKIWGGGALIREGALNRENTVCVKLI